MININNLSTLTITSLSLSIVFTVLAIAGIFFSMYRKGSFKNEFSKFACVVILPFVALTMWILTGLSISSLANNEALAIILSMIISAGVISIIYFIAKSIDGLKDKEDELDENASKQELVEELIKVETDLNNLKNIIDDVIDEPKQAVKAEKVVIIKEIQPTVEEKKEDVKEVEVKEEKTNKELPEKSEEVIKEEVTIEQIPEETEEKDEVVEDDGKNNVKNDQVVEETVEVETVNETVNEVEETKEPKTTVDEIQRESDFIKSLNELLEELENNPNE